MKALRRFVMRLAASLLRRRDEERLREELAEHLSLLTEDYVRSGLSVDEARRRARLTLGTDASISDAYGDEQRLGWFEDAGKDLRAAFRGLRRYPLAASVAVISLAAGIGATTISLTIRDAVYRKFPPLYVEPQQISLVSVNLANLPAGRGETTVPAALYNAWSTNGTQSAAFSHRGTHELRAGDRTQMVSVRAVTPNAFDFLGVAPALGKGLSATGNGGNTVVLSHRLCQQLFDGSSDAVGKVLWIDNAPHTVAGVMPERFWIFDTASPVWTALDTQALPPNEPVQMLVRRPPGVSAAALEAQLRAGLENYAQGEAAGNRNFVIGISGIEGTPLARQVAVAVPFLLGTAVLLTFLIACANVAVLMFAQWTLRDREISIRASIGASRGRIVRMLLTESTLIAIVSGALGVGVTLALRTLVVSNSGDIAFYDLSIDPAIFFQVCLVTLFAGLLTGIMPALYETRKMHLNPSRSLRGSDRVRQHLRHSLVVFEIAVTVALLVVTGSMIDGYRRALDADLGFDTEPLVAVRLESPQGVPEEEVFRELAELPGVTAVAASTSVPFGGGGAREQVSNAADSSLAISAEKAAIRGPFFAALGVSLVAGRSFSDGELPEARSVVINEALARKLFPQGNALGATVWLAAVPHDVVGIVHNYASGSLRNPADEARIFVPLPGGHTTPRLQFVVRSASDPAPLVLAMQRVLNRIVPDARVSRAHTFQEVIQAGGQEILVGTAPLLPLISIGTLLTLAGIYGVLAFAVSRRARELAIRIAVGASPQELVWEVARHTSKLGVAGAGIGIAVSFALARVVRASGGAGSVFDPPITAFIGPVIAIALLGLIATWIPARRAASIDPSLLMREE
ncbi:MAG: ABC transporter permease [Bryobacterales bacterium]|nr:ABC transporter permease [Bryobacterales bacterium]